MNLTDTEIMANLHIGDNPRRSIYVEEVDVALLFGEHTKTPIEPGIRHRAVAHLPHGNPFAANEYAEWVFHHWLRGRRCLIRGPHHITTDICHRILVLAGCRPEDTHLYLEAS